MSSARDLLLQLELLVLMADPGSSTIAPFLSEHRPALAILLGLTEHEISALGTLPEEILVFYLGPVLRRLQARRREMQQARKEQQQSIRVQRVFEKVRWAGARAIFEPSAMLELLRALTTPFLVLAAPHFELALPASRLRQAARALGHHPDLQVHADRDGLHFLWRQGVGRLRLCPRVLPRTPQALQVIQLMAPESMGLQAAQ